MERLLTNRIGPCSVPIGPSSHNILQKRPPSARRILLILPPAMKFSFKFIFIFTVFMMVFVRASSDEGNEDESIENEDSSTSESTSASASESSKNTTTTNNNDSPTPSSNSGTLASNNPNIGTAAVSDLGEIDRKTGLSRGTLQMLARLSHCKRQLLLNYRRLLRSPVIRLQFYRDLYQRHQAEYVATGCGEGGDEKVKLGFKERAMLLGDPFFRAKVEKLMRGRQPVGVAINGPVRYPNDIVMDNTQPPQNVLAVTKVY